MTLSPFRDGTFIESVCVKTCAAATRLGSIFYFTRAYLHPNTRKSGASRGPRNPPGATISSAPSGLVLCGFVPLPQPKLSSHKDSHVLGYDCAAFRVAKRDGWHRVVRTEEQIPHPSKTGLGWGCPTPVNEPGVGVASTVTLGRIKFGVGTTDGQHLPIQ